MIDREKVIKGLECCTNNGTVCFSDCPYCKVFTMANGKCITALQANALALLKDDETQLQYRDDHIAMYQAEIKWLEAMLKEQEAVKPKSKVRHGANAQIQHFCGNCNSMLHGKPKYCSECGKAVKWE